LDNAGVSSPNAVRVFCRRTAARGNHVGFFFARIMGQDYTDVTATATARYKTTQCGVIVGLDYVSLTGENYVDSYKSAEGPYLPGNAGQNGNVCSNGSMLVKDSAAIYGDAHPGPDGLVYDYSTIGVSGDTSPLTEPLHYPVADSSDAQANNDNASIPNTSAGTSPIMMGYLYISGAYHLELPPGTYYFGGIYLSGGATLGVSGETIMYVDGEVRMSGASVINSTMLPQNLQLYVDGGKVTMSGESEFYGVVYAPGEEVVRSGDTDFYGSIISKKLSFSGGGGIHADESLDLELLDSGIKRTALVD
jgi:hypothetical protein